MKHMIGRGPRPWVILSIAVAVAMFLMAGAREARAASASSVFDWSISNYYASGPVNPGFTGYSLRNETAVTVQNQTYLVYGVRDYGINLVWGYRPASANIRFERQSGSGPLKYGEPVAIEVGGGGYLKHQSRLFGIDLVWSSTPVYQWRIFGQGKKIGDVVSTADKVGLYNTSYYTGYMVYQTRDYGINLDWKGGALPPSTASVSLGYRFPSFGALSCTGSVTFRLTPISLTGTIGISTQTFAHTPASSTFPSFGYCYREVVAIGLRAGTWRIDANISGIPGSCQVVLSVNSSAFFTAGVAGCSTSLGYP